MNHELKFRQCVVRLSTKVGLAFRSAIIGDILVPAVPWLLSRPTVAHYCLRPHIQPEPSSLVAIYKVPMASIACGYVGQASGTRNAGGVDMWAAEREYKCTPKMPTRVLHSPHHVLPCILPYTPHHPSHAMQHNCAGTQCRACHRHAMQCNALQ